MPGTQRSSLRRQTGSDLLSSSVVSSRCNMAGMVDCLKSILVLVGIVFLFVVLAVAQSDSQMPLDAHPLPPQPVPKTVDEAVLALKTQWLSQRDLDWILGNPRKEAVATLYRPFGTGVRNQFGLWDKNQELRTSCGVNEAEACSVVIFNRLWESVRSDADPALVQQLDCQIQLAEAIRIHYKGFHRMTTGALLKAIQSQINDQLPKLVAAGKPTCQGSLTLAAVGKLDKSCYVEASFATNRADKIKVASLEAVLGRLGSSNLFTTSHVPPKLPSISGANANSRF